MAILRISFTADGFGSSYQAHNRYKLVISYASEPAAKLSLGINASFSNYKR